jgi:hypothetical protein
MLSSPYLKNYDPIINFLGNTKLDKNYVLQMDKSNTEPTSFNGTDGLASLFQKNNS